MQCLILTQNLYLIFYGKIKDNGYIFRGDNCQIDFAFFSEQGKL